MQDRYIRASELKSFAFCHRAWFLERQGPDSTLQDERARGIAEHIEHGVHVEQTTATNRTASLLFTLGFIGLVAAVLTWWLSR